MTKKVLIIAGEASGDQHAAKVLQQIKKTQTDLDCFGIGGPRLRDENFECLLPCESLSVIGLVEIFSKFKVIKQALKTIKQTIDERKPDLVILVDFSGFNLRIAKYAKNAGIKVLYFISPQIWAWRRYRIHIVKKYVDHMAVIFPFESAFYDEYGVANTYVGNPVFNEVMQYQKANVASSNDHPLTIGLFPGSRQSEIKSLLPIMIEAAIKLKQLHPECQFVLPKAETIPLDLIQQHIPQNLPLTIVTKPINQVIDQCDLIISASGTITLQIALLGKPQIVTYKVNRFNALLVRLLSNIRHFAMCNLILKKEVAKELLQHHLTVDNIIEECQLLLTDANYRQNKIDLMRELKTCFDDKDTAENTAIIAIKMLDLS